MHLDYNRLKCDFWENRCKTHLAAVFVIRSSQTLLLQLKDPMKIQKLRLEQFTAFDDTNLVFDPGINVLIGANSTGKTHILKAMYAMLKVCENARRNGLPADPGALESIFAQKFMRVFKPDTLGRLVRRAVGQRTGSLSLTYGKRELHIQLTTQSNLNLEYKLLPDPVRPIYLPPQEFLSLYEGFISAYELRETAFDETYFDLAVALNARPISGQRQREIQQLIKPLEGLVKGSVSERNGRFYVRLPEGTLEAPLVSEGLRKLACLKYLITNGSLTPNGILFWDEPEANLNPQSITVVVNFLKNLAASGVQIFIATHDYLLTQELSLLAEYRDAPVKFLSLHKPDKQAGVMVETGNSLAEIENNPILQEFAAHYDREVELFQRA